MIKSATTHRGRQTLLKALPAAILLVLAPCVHAGDSAAPAAQAQTASHHCSNKEQANGSCAKHGAKQSTTNLQKVIVTGIRASISNAIELKRDSEGISDSIVAEGIGKLPDDNVAAALQRITGVQVVRGAAEVNTVLIRGLPNVATTLNGRDIFTTTGRSVSLSDIPADLVERVTVHKTASAKDIAGGIGGLINIQTRRPFDFKKGWTVAGGVRDVHSKLSGKNDPNGSVTVNDLWDSSVGKMGLMVSGSYQHQRYEGNNTFNGLYYKRPNPVNTSQDIYIPTDIGAIYNMGNRQRTSGDVSFQWQPNHNTQLYAEGFYVKYRDGSQLPFWIPLPTLANSSNTTSVTLKPGTNIAQTMTATNLFTLTSNQAFQNQSQTYQTAIGGKWHGDNGVTVKTDLSYTKSTARNKTFIVDTFFIAPKINFNFANHGAADALVTNADGSPYDVTNPANYSLFEYFDDWSRQVGKSWAWKNDATFPVKWGPVDSIDAGFRVAQRKAYNVAGNTGAKLNISGNPLPMTAFPGLAEVTPNNLLEGSRHTSTSQWLVSNRKYLLSNSAMLRQAFGYSPNRPAQNPALFFNDKEDNYDAYAQANYSSSLGGLPVDGYLGVRLIRLNSVLRGTNESNGVRSPVNIHKSVTEALPSFMANISLTDNLLWRLGYGKTLSRPSFAALNPELTLNSAAQTLAATGSGGNPYLNAIKSSDFDTSLEWYFKPGSLLSVAAFYRKINGYIETYAKDEVINGVTYSVSRPRNTGNGHLKGIEVAYTDFFRSLPGWLSGFGTQLNGTLISAKTQSPSGAMQDVVNVSKYSYNAVLIYQKDKLSARLAYNWRSKYASSFNQSGDQPPSIYFGPQHRLDLAIDYDINKNLTVALEGRNLLGDTSIDYFGTNPYLYPRDVINSERTYSLGVRFNF